MKHRFINKKTGVEARVIAMYLDSDGVMQIDGYDTVEDLMDDYAAYEEYNPPKEPLIKDEKIRKAVRAWAEACNLKHVTYKQASNEFYDADTRGAFAIRFTLMPVEVYLEDGECYTIAELCGEEEE